MHASEVVVHLLVRLDLILVEVGRSVSHITLIVLIETAQLVGVDHRKHLAKALANSSDAL